jgi:hypothetical protein
MEGKTGYTRRRNSKNSHVNEGDQSPIYFENIIFKKTEE